MTAPGLGSPRLGVAARGVMAQHSKSFTVASRLLDTRTADAVAVLYAWCRRADDAIDASARGEQPARLQELWSDLDSVCEGRAQVDPLLAELQLVFAAYHVPAAYPRTLLEGMQMDVNGQPYATLAELYGYCYRVAGVVGVMLCHVFGVSSEAALRHAAHLGMAMQLTNVARDVLEDWERGRLYLPDELLEQSGAGNLRGALGKALPPRAREPLARAIRELLRQAEHWYRSADSAMTALPFRAQLATRAARLIYSRIGQELAAQNYDVFAGRAVVSGRVKAWLVLRALLGSLAALPAALRFRAVPRHGLLRYPVDVLP
jgi:phytoene synthase